MVLENISNLTQAVDASILLKPLSSLTRVFQALGGLALIYVFFTVLNYFLNRKKQKDIEAIKQIVERIDRKIKK